MPLGYVGKLLRVNLSSRRISEEPLPPEEVLRRYVGGTGLGVWLLCRELPGGAKAKDPDNPLIFTTGPVTGTLIPTAADFTVVGLNYDIGYTLLTSHSHGSWGAQLKRAGYDGLILEGHSKEPLYLWVRDGGAELRDASRLWGLDTHETEEAVRSDLGEGEASVAAIGPAGENCVHGAAICNDFHHVAASGGVGALMGLKRLKAIATHGTGPVRAADGFELMRITQEWIPHLDRIGFVVLPQRYEKFSLGGSRVAVKNLESAAAGYEFARSVEAGARRFEVRRVACHGCPIACTYRATITEGPYRGHTATLAGGGENMEGAAGMAGVTEPGTVLYMTDLCDRLGFSSGEVGIALGWAFECYERGLLTRGDTGGLELTWGNADAAIALVRQMARREGLGALLAEGPRHAARKVGKDSERYLVHVKGSGFNLHDWRIHWTILLGQAVSQAGGCWQGGGMVDYYPDPDLGYPEARPIAAREGTPEASRKTQIKRLWEDTVGICMFSVVPSHEGMIHLPVRAVAAATGWGDFTLEEALLVGERVMNLQRLFSVKRGRTLLHDLDVGEKLLEAPKDGVAAGRAFGPHLKDMVQEYYRLNGWDPETGAPLPDTLRRLGLEAFAA